MNYPRRQRVYGYRVAIVMLSWLCGFSWAYMLPTGQALIASTMSVHSAIAASVTTCGYGNVKVQHAEPSELLAVCDALRDTLTYFKNIGFQIDPRFTSVFRDGSGVEIREAGWAGSYFDRKSLKVFVFRDTAYKPWGMPRTPEISASFLRHEIVHTALVAILDDAYEDIRPEWHEFIAYAVQIDLMSEHLRDQLLKRYPTTEAFPTLQSVNEFTYGGDPDGFAVAAYKTYVANGGSSFIEKLVRFEIVPPSLPMLFLEQFLEQDKARVQ